MPNLTTIGKSCMIMPRHWMVSDYSKVQNTYEAFLKAGRKVMFTGTPCQLAGLRLFLRKDYGDQLLKVDVVCHGVPSPMVWNDYLKYIRTQVGKNSADDMPVITGISFRDKK